MVSWKSKKKLVVSRSNVEVHYRAMANAIDEILWLRSLLQDLGVQLEEPTLLFCDNEATIHISANLVYHERTKHIKLDCHFSWKSCELES